MTRHLPPAAFVLLVCLFALHGCHKQRVDASTEATPRPAREVLPVERVALELTGPGLESPRVFTYQQLADLEPTRLDGMLMQKTYEPDEVTSWRGPALDALLAAANVKSGPMNLTLRAVDGYEVVATRTELHSAIIALQDGNGRWLAELDNTCPLRLVPPELPGNYWVMNLARITVHPRSSP